MNSPEPAAAPSVLSILGSTGSIGQQTLDLVRADRRRFQVAALSALSNVDLIVKQAREFRPQVVAVADPAAAERVQAELGPEFRVVGGESGGIEAATDAGADIVVAAIVGSAGLRPVVAALEAGKNVALANKEALVTAGELVIKTARRSGSLIMPIDSEHNSIYQCLLGRESGDVIRKIVLTASGGPFLNHSAADLERIAPADAVRHPRWNMGPKISVDSATLMNKGLEVIEAAHLFNLPGEKIEVLVHPQSLVHGLVEFVDGSIVAVMYQTDMRVPISFALGALSSAEPHKRRGARLNHGLVPALNLAAEGRLDFSAPDLQRFPALRLSYDVLARGGTAGATLNAANEVAVAAFLANKIRFTSIYKIVEQTVASCRIDVYDTIEQVEEADSVARAVASELIRAAE